MDGYEYALAADPVSAREARTFTRTVLAEAGCVDDGSAALVVSELVTNAVVHGREPIRLHLWRHPGRFRVGVSDAATERPRMHGSEPMVGSPTRGLSIVERLALGWGTDPLERGKLVWADIECADEHAHPNGSSTRR